MPKKLISLRVHELTNRQLKELAARWNATQAEVVSEAISRLYQQEIGNKPAQGEE